MPDSVYRVVLPERSNPPHPLGRHVEHDERSRSFAFSSPAAVDIHDVSWHRRVPIYDQGQLGSCTAHALCGALSTAPDTHRFTSERNIIKVYSRATVIDGFDGSYPPDDTGSSGLAVAQVALERKWISRYEHAFSFDAVLQALMFGPGITGTAWRTGMFTPDSDGRVRTLGGVAGGHEYEVYGVDVARKRIWCCNSWGSGWGLIGRFYLTWDDYRELLADDGDFTVLVP